MPLGAQTWREAAELRGLIESDQEYHDTMEEAALTQMPQQLRHVFVQILAHCQAGNPKKL